MIGGGGFKALIESGGGRGLYAGVWGNLAGVVPSSALFMSVYEPVKHAVSARRRSGRRRPGRALLWCSGPACVLRRCFDLCIDPLSRVDPAPHPPTTPTHNASTPHRPYPPKKVYKHTGDPESFWGPVWAGVAAGAAASLTRVPTEVVKQRLQTREFAGAVQAVRAILAKEGVRGLYAGYGAFLLRDLPFDAIEFVAYEQVGFFWGGEVGCCQGVKGWWGGVVV